MTNTESTSLIKDGDHYVLHARGGYDGYLNMKFDSPEDALDFMAYLWGLNSSVSAYQKSDETSGTHPRILDKLVKESQE